MTENLVFTKSAKFIAMVTVSIGAILTILGVVGFNVNSGSYNTPPWEIIPEFFLGGGLSCIFSGIIIGVLCEISQNIAAMSGRKLGGGGDVEVPLAASRYERASDPWDAT
jgi:hypothetical protein